MAAQLSQPRQMRKGSVAVRFMKCGKKDCACTENPDARHGPYFTLTRSVKGKTQSRYLTSQQAETAKRQIEDGQNFRKIVEQYWDACQEWSDELLSPRDDSLESPKKKGSKKPSPRKSKPKSKT